MGENYTRLTYEQCVDGKVSTTIIKRDYWDVNLEDLTEMLQELLLGAGWHPKTIKDLFFYEGLLDESNDL